MPAAQPIENKGALQLGAREHLYMTLRPHYLAFFRYFVVGLLLILWSVAVYWMHYEDWLSFTCGDSTINSLMPALVFIGGACLVGWCAMAGYGGALRGMFWAAIISLIALSLLYIWYWDDPEFIPTLTVIFGLSMGLVAMLMAAIYRRAFSYFITNQRIVLRYKMFSMEENTLRFEKIEDFKVIRSFVFRIFGLGTIRAYTGTEDGKADADRDFDGPKEALYGIRKPTQVKQMLIEIVLERDQYDERMVEMLEEKRDPRPAQEEPTPTPEPPAPAAAVAAVAYYQPAPAPEPEPVPQPAKNFERVEQPVQQAPIPPPPPSQEPSEDPEASPVRMMYPQAEEPVTQFTLEGGADMEFRDSSPKKGAPPPKKPRPIVEDDDPSREVYDEKKPRAL